MAGIHTLLLGVPRAASAEDIERAYRDRRRRLHPDRASESNKVMAEDMTKLVGSAYAVLADPGRRAAYDALVETRQAGPRRPQADRQSAKPSPGEADSADLWAGAATGWAPPAGATTESAGWHDGHAGTGPTSRLPRNNGDEYADDVIDDPWNSFPGRQQPGSRPTPAYDRYQRYPGPDPYPRVRHEVQYRPYSPGFSGRAVAALLFAWLLPPLGVILAINARLDIRSSGRRGMGIAITALVMGAILTIADVAVLVTST